MGRPKQLYIEATGTTLFKGPRTTIWYRGYIGNLALLADSLDIAHSDEGGILLAAFDRWGTDLGQRLEGEFALVCQDVASGTASLHHDEYGLVPLFYRVSSDGLHVGFHLDDLVSCPGQSDLDGDYIRELLRFGDVYSARTPYTTVKRLLPGQCALWDGSSLALADCWSPPTKPQHASFSDNAAELRRLIGAAVAAALSAQGSTWCELSGGLDSSTVLATALRATTGPLDAVTYAYPSAPAADESIWVARFREALPVPLHTVDGDACPPFGGSLGPGHAEPTIGLHHAARDAALIAVLTAHGVDHLLTGMGGDEVLFGYRLKPYFVMDYLRALQPVTARKELSEWSARVFPRRSSLHWLTQLRESPSFRPSPNAPVAPWLSRATVKSAGRGLRDMRSPTAPEPSLAKRRYMEAVMTGARVVSTCLATRRCRTQFRNPLFNRTLVQFCRDLPWQHQAGGEVLRPLLRDAMRGVLPEPTRARTDKPNFDQVLFRGLRDACPALTGGARDSYLAQAGFIDPDIWTQTLHKARLGYAPHFKAFLVTANLQVWLKFRLNF